MFPVVYATNLCHAGAVAQTCVRGRHTAPWACRDGVVAGLPTRCRAPSVAALRGRSASRQRAEGQPAAVVVIEVYFSEAGGVDLARHLRERLTSAVMTVVVDDLSDSERERVTVTSRIEEGELRFERPDREP